MGGKFGEMSTLMNYTFQSFNFRNRQGARPFYDLIANIAAEEYGHIELVAATINTMLTGRRDGATARAADYGVNTAAVHRRRQGRAAAGLRWQAVDRRLRHSRPATSSRT